MLTTAEASRAIAAAMPLFDVEDVNLEDAAGRVLRQPVGAERDQPPFDRVTMDGIAIQLAAVAAGSRRLGIQGTQHAGDPVQTLAGGTHCIEVMTGCVLPAGTDCVVPVERITVNDGYATIDADYALTQHQFIHPQGSDFRLGAELLHAGSRITAMDVAIIASSGLARISVSRLPAIRVISTGNELVPAGQPLEAHQIRLSNGPAVVAMLSQNGFSNAQHEHLADDRDVMRRRLAALLDTSDVLVLSGGVSMGKADFVPQILRELGVNEIFHKVSQRPGKPLWFGTGPAQQVVFALPGNPVSTLVCSRQYVVPALIQASGESACAATTAQLAEYVSFKPDLTAFLPARTCVADGVNIATPAPTNTSGDFAALHGTDGYVELVSNQSAFPAGTCVPFHPWFCR